MVKGFSDPDIHYVNLETEADKEAAGTMFHAMQAVTGTQTHNPVWASEDSKRVMKGQQQGVEGFMKKSSATTGLFERIAMENLAVYANHTGGEVDDLSAMRDWFQQNPEKMVVPIKGKMVTLESQSDAVFKEFAIVQATA